MIKIIALFWLVGVGLLVAAIGLRQWRTKAIHSWFAFGLFLGSAVILASAYLLYVNSELTMSVTALGFLIVHILAVFIARHIHGRINWFNQTGRAVVLLFLLILVYLGLD